MNESSPEFKLLETGTLIEFDIIGQDVQTAFDEENVFVKVELQFKVEDELDDPEDIVEWGAFGFIFAIAAQSFNDARPRGHSDIDYEADDQLMLADFIECLTFGIDGLKFHGDYIRGRSLKTDIAVNTHGVVIVSTYGRGESLLRWLDLLKGKKHLKEV
ncbi:MAG: hypothetical protein JKY88_05470 [Pseudomonadales bacterium]|nr:hypothetical protein [Pseudomonadales bacterium]